MFLKHCVYVTCPAGRPWSATCTLRKGLESPPHEPLVFPSHGHYLQPAFDTGTLDIEFVPEDELEEDPDVAYARYPSDDRSRM